MIEVRTYDGDARDLVAFATEAWKPSGSGLPHAPLWSEGYFDWQLLKNPHAAAELRVAAYDGGQLIGTLFAEPHDFLRRGEPTRGTLGSWLTVSPAYRGRGVASLLAEELRIRHRERGERFLIGFGLLGSGGEKFWSRQRDTLLPGKVGFWVRVLDVSAVASWSTSLRDRLGVQLLRLWPGLSEGTIPATDLRPYRDTDLEDCLELCNRPASTVDLGLLWSRERLAHQLRFDAAASSHVLTNGTGVVGVVNYYLLAFSGREERTMAILDVVEFDGAAAERDRVRLVARALSEARDRGACSALLLRQPGAPKRALLAAGFIPLPSDFAWIVTFVAEPESMRAVRRIRALWR